MNHGIHSIAGACHFEILSWDSNNPGGWWPRYFQPEHSENSKNIPGHNHDIPIYKVPAPSCFSSWFSQYPNKRFNRSCDGFL